MSPETARKIVVAAALVGSAAIVYSGAAAKTPGTTVYRRVWGLLLLTTGGAVLADFAPGIVGPYLGLVLLGFLLHNRVGLGGLLGAGETAIQNPTSTGGTP